MAKRKSNIEKLIDFAYSTDEAGLANAISTLKGLQARLFPKVPSKPSKPRKVRADKGVTRDTMLTKANGGDGVDATT